jgi:peptidoglycan/LPS O-acetylase OafA/YrhL
MRRHDIDWLRVIALGLLIVYHVVGTFQPWGKRFFFIQNDQTLEGLWVPISMINVWRIPILFMISGMGVRFAMEWRDWKQLLKERTMRILVPFVFGFFVVCPIPIAMAMLLYDSQVAYLPNAGHLWFLANIYLYVLLLLPLLVWLKGRPDNLILRGLGALLRLRFGIFLLALPMVAETFLVKPMYFTLYGQTIHGLWLGLICFLTGFLLVSKKEVFWQAVERVRYGALVLAFALYLVRLLYFELEGPNILSAFESMCWMLGLLGFASATLNKPSRGLTYLNRAVYPVYIIHLPLQYLYSYFIFPLSIPAIAKLVLVLALTLGSSLAMYELIIRRARWIRPLFGMKLKRGSDNPLSALS